MAYRTPLETRLAKNVTKAITDFGLIEDGDRVMVGLSGGKDSWALLQILDVLRQRAPIDFTLVAVNVDSGYEDYKHDASPRPARARGWELRIEHTTIGDVMDDMLDAGDTPCSLCARLRRGVLYRLAGRSRRHEDRARPPSRRLRRDAAAEPVLRRRAQGDAGAAGVRQRQHVVIRPLVYVTEAEARAYARENDLPVIGCCCPACGDLGLQRQRVKRLIMELEREHPHVKASMMKALDNVMPRHLLDRRLNPCATCTIGSPPTSTRWRTCPPTCR